MTAATSPALALPELPTIGWVDGDSVKRFQRGYLSDVLLFKDKTYQDDVAVVLHSDALTYGQQCAQAQGEAQAAEIAQERELAIKACKLAAQFKAALQHIADCYPVNQPHASAEKELCEYARAALKSEAA